MSTEILKTEKEEAAPEKAVTKEELQENGLRQCLSSLLLRKGLADWSEWSGALPACLAEPYSRLEWQPPRAGLQLPLASH